MDLAFILLLFLVVVKIEGEITSPCPKYFVFEPNKSEDDRWYGIITLESKRSTLNGVTLDLEFDKSIIQLGNFFGPLSANSDNTKFSIKNSNKQITPTKPLKVEIYAVYDPYFDTVPPKLTKIKLNGREICPKYQEEQSNYNFNSPTILTQINLPTCGVSIVTSTGLITHGDDTVKGQWPWHAALFGKHGTEKNYLCGGTLISDQQILTAAHCTAFGQTTQDPKNFIVILGKHALWSDGKDEQIFTVTKIDVHEKFNRTNFFNDISLLHLDKPIKYNDFVRPVCLWSQGVNLNTVVNQVGTAAGWGRDHENNENTDLLMMAHMPVIDRLNCIYSQRVYYSLFVNDENFCAGYRNGTSVCNGDSGGGLVFPRPGTSGPNTVWELRGIVSNTLSKPDRTCDPNYYVLFTDVAKYLDWINNKIKT